MPDRKGMGLDWKPHCLWMGKASFWTLMEPGLHWGFLSGLGFHPRECGLQDRPIGKYRSRTSTGSGWADVPLGFQWSGKRNNGGHRGLGRVQGLDRDRLGRISGNRNKDGAIAFVVPRAGKGSWPRFSIWLFPHRVRQGLGWNFLWGRAGNPCRAEARIRAEACRTGRNGLRSTGYR